MIPGRGGGREEFGGGVRTCLSVCPFVRACEGITENPLGFTFTLNTQQELPVAEVTGISAIMMMIRH